MVGAGVQCFRVLVLLSRDLKTQLTQMCNRRKTTFCIQAIEQVLEADSVWNGSSHMSKDTQGPGYFPGGRGWSLRGVVDY